MLKIPKIIHQVYDSREGNKTSEELFDELLKISSTWKINHPQWEYHLWDHNAIDAFMEEYYPQYIIPYFKFKYPVQRWDSIRYILIYHYGGFYVDMDYESLEPLDNLLENVKCFFGCEPDSHRPSNLPIFLGNALFGSIAKDSFIELLFKECFNISNVNENIGKKEFVLETTGPGMVNKMYKKFADKKKITLLPPELVAPWSYGEVRLYLSGKCTSLMEEKLENAHCVHYFLGTWL